jgi:hypothetical protein
MFLRYSTSSSTATLRQQQLFDYNYYYTLFLDYYLLAKLSSLIYSGTYHC